MKNILVTTDLSPESKVAIPIASEIAKKFGAQLVLALVGQELMAIQASYGVELPLYLDPAVQKEIDERLKQDLQRFSDEVFGQAPVKTIFKSGEISPADGILAIAKDIDADLIVIASHGRSGVRRVLLGSVAERVLRHAPCPVLVVPVRT
ncbi:MAG: universal stress protein [Proteobacteria bacterium]|nr:universal stress protein [Pseudomonadota bacterium]